MEGEVRCILIGGSSHVGKSTLAAAWASALGWQVVSTDSLARHPGRPWPVAGRKVPAHVVEHYRTLSDGQLLESNLVHYRGMWPTIERLVRTHAEAPTSGLVLEGSGCWPDEAATLGLPRVGAVWLTTTGELISRRIRRQSGYADADAAGRLLIERFICRSQLFNERLAERLAALGLPRGEVDGDEHPALLLARCRERLTMLGQPSV